MSSLAIHPETRALLKPEPRSRGGAISIRTAEAGAADLKFIDGLQRVHSKQVGWMPTQQLEANIKQGNILIAEDEMRKPVGYCLFKDKYFKREDVGIVYQLNVAPHKQRGLVGAALIKAAFERSAWGVKLFCCWCAQDIEANHFWESLGFVPLAFRAGSRGAAQGGRRKEGRIHIFWQRRIRESDVETPYWYPSETSGGALKENRIVLPIPPGTHWSDAKPMVVPGANALETDNAPPSTPARAPQRKKPSKPGMARPKGVARGGLWFAPAKPVKSDAVAKGDKSTSEKRPKEKNDPKLIAMAREFRDRYLDEVNTGRCLPEAWGAGKYDVSRNLESATVSQPPNLLTAEAA